LQIKIYF